jgi:hypothetical protein
MTRKGRSLAWLTRQGYLAGDVEKFNSFTKRRTDFLGLFDLLAVHKDAPGVLGVQVTAGGGDIQKHIRKMQKSPNLAAWIHAGNEACIHSWALRGPRGKRKVWTCVEIPVTP